MNQIGLDVPQSKSLAQKLNNLLANYHIFYINVRGYHWNIKGDKFFELHLKFEELYNDIVLKIDEIAERVKTLGETPLHTFTDYLQVSAITETKNISDGKTAAQHILDSLRQLLILQREILNLSAEANDEGTNALMSDYIRAQEKMVWMYNAYLS
ncbi:MAG TPA: Dps family protein [Flavipsychrobacter sp.]|nr:Dps family protein [Flavipsychrobacter sp.]